MIVIRIGDNNVITVEEEGPVKTSKVISPDQFFAILADSAQTRISTPVLPKNCVHYANTGAEEVFVLERPAHRRKVVYLGSEFADVGFPKLVFRIALSKSSGRISFTRVAAVKDFQVRPETEMYRYPFSNVHPDGEACWGNCGLPKIEHPYQLSGIPDLFLAQEDNGDLYDGANRSGLVYRELLQRLQKKNFPERWLRRFDYAPTFEEFMNL